MKKYIAVIALTVTLVMLPSACRKTVTSSNPKVLAVNALFDASDVSHEISNGLGAADETLKQLQATEPQYYAAAKPYLQEIAKANDKAIAAIRAAQAGDDSVDWRASLLAVASKASSFDPATFGFKNSNSQKLVITGFNLLRITLAVIPQKFGGK